MFQIGPSWIGEADEVAEAVIATAWDHRIVAADAHLFSEHLQHVVGHVSVVDEAHRLGGQSLFERRGHLLHQAHLNLVGEIELRISGQLNGEALHRVELKETGKQLL